MMSYSLLSSDEEVLLLSLGLKGDEEKEQYGRFKGGRKRIQNTVSTFKGRRCILIYIHNERLTDALTTQHLGHPLQHHTSLF